MNLLCEWVQSNRYGSFAMGSVDRVPRRKYHSLFLMREPGFGDPLNLVSEVGEYLEVGGELFMLHGFDFGDRIDPSGFRHLEDFEFRPWPKWRYRVAGMEIERVLAFDPDRELVRLHYTLRGVKAPVQLKLRPYLLYRPMDHLTRQNPFLNGSARLDSLAAGSDEPLSLSFEPYAKLPRLHLRLLGARAGFAPRGTWVEGLHYSVERDRGYPFIEDCFVPGDIEIEVAQDASFTLEISAGEAPPAAGSDFKPPVIGKSLSDRLAWAAKSYLTQTKGGFHSIIAGFPWFGSWGRDTFISLRGICLERGEIEAAEKILESYGKGIVEALKTRGIVCVISESGLNLTGIDTPLLYCYAVQMLKQYAPDSRWEEFMPVVCDILNALRQGADRRIRIGFDGGIYLEQGPWAVTWMDVLLDGHPVTPRWGYAVDVNALFYNDMKFAVDWAKKKNPLFAEEWGALLEEAQNGFIRRFWSPEKGYLADTSWSDADAADFSLRPNQLWALALPHSPLGDHLKSIGTRVLDAVRQELICEVGVRTLAPSDPKYRGTYRGTQKERDLHYHQGIIWPWLLGIYADAVERIHGRERLREEVEPLLRRLSAHLEEEACLGQISELFEDLPHQATGAPAQAWSVAEVLRVAKKLENGGGTLAPGKGSKTGAKMKASAGSAASRRKK